MPEGRPDQVTYYVTRDETHFTEADRLTNSVVMVWKGDDLDFEPESVANYAVRTGLVKNEEISVAVLGGGRYLIHLPTGLAPDTFIRATPADLWDFGLTFEPWSPLRGAEVKVPHFKVLLNLVGFPIEIWKEEEVRKAVSSFGIFLGTIPPENPADFSQWTAVIATEDLAQVPSKVKVRLGGLDKVVPITVVTWSHAPIYKAAQMPQEPPIYTAPTRDTSEDSSGDECLMDEDEMIPVSRRAIQEICRGIDPEALPWQFRELLAAGKEAAEENLRQIVVQDATENPPAVAEKLQIEGRQTGSSAVPEAQNGSTSGIPDRAVPHTEPMRPSPIALRVLRDAQACVAATRKAKEKSHQQSDSPARVPSARKQTNQRAPKDKEKMPRMSQTAANKNDTQSTRVHFRAQIPKKIVTRVPHRNQAIHPQLTPKGITIRDPNPPAPVILMRRKDKHVSTRALGEQEAQEAKKSNRLKRKADIQFRAQTPEPTKTIRAETSRPGPSRPRNKEGCNLNPEGFFEVHVQYDRCVDLAYNLGLKPGDVLQTIEEDNAARREDLAKQAQIDQGSEIDPPARGPQEQGQDDEQARVRFDYTDTDDDLGSEEE